VFSVLSNKTGISFSVKVQPGASRTSVVGVEGDFLKVRLAATPIDGKANKALIEVLAQKLDVPKSSVRICSGLSSRRKVISVEHCSERRFRDFLSILEGLSS
jgi:uncharacterized protein